jgi:4-hydroxy-2-oxoheptanedioate aldolase
MNNMERKMVDVLLDLKENHYVVGIKAEFEAEGTRIEEAMRLKEVISKAGLGLTMKIGGCEAIRDMYEARLIGVDRVVAPMVETAYALKKFLNATQLVFPPEEREHITFCVNVETIEGCNNFERMLAIPEIGILNGIIMGRVDLTGSMGLSREDINTPQVFKITKEVFTRAKAKGMECAIGGGVGKEAIPFFKELPAGLLDRYETRKIIFKCPEALYDDPEKGILKAVGFELLWLKNKRDFYGMIFNEDRIRIEMLESRYRRLIEEAGGKYE